MPTGVVVAAGGKNASDFDVVDGVIRWIKVDSYRSVGGIVPDRATVVWKSNWKESLGFTDVEGAAAHADDGVDEIRRDAGKLRSDEVFGAGMSSNWVGV